MLWLCDKTGAAASEHWHKSPNLLISQKSRQTSCCPTSVVARGLRGAMCQRSDIAEPYVVLPGSYFTPNVFSRELPDVGPPVWFSVDNCCYPSCCPQWLLLPYLRNELFSKEDRTEVRASTFFFPHVLSSKCSHIKGGLCLDADPFLSHCSNWAQVNHRYLIGEEKILSHLFSNYYQEECN